MGLSGLFSSRASDPLLAAIREGKGAEACAHLDMGADPDTEEKGVTALMLAAEAGMEDVVDKLLEKGADAGRKNNLGMSADMYAHTSGHRLLGEKIERAAAKTDIGMIKALNMAVFKGEIENVKKLVGKGVDVNAAADDDWPPLFWAAYKGYEDVVAFLIESGADIHARFRNEATPLHYAASDGRTDVALLLLEKGADASAKSRFGHTPARAAELAGYRNTAAAIRNYKPAPPPPLKPRGFAL